MRIVFFEGKRGPTQGSLLEKHVCQLFQEFVMLQQVATRRDQKDSSQASTRVVVGLPAS